MAQSNAKILFHGLVWPGAAGSVMWGAMTLAIDPRPIEPNGVSIFARLAVLVLLAAYLSGNWIRTYDEDGGFWYWVFDAAHILILSSFAIGAATGSPFSS